MKKIIRWQPEWAQTIIYWSLSLIIFFFSLILSLENTRPYWKSNLIMGLFLVFLFLGYRRSFILTTQSIKVRYAAFWKDKVIRLQEIDSVTPMKKGIKIKYIGQKEPSLYLMPKKGETAFLLYIQTNEEKNIQKLNTQTNEN
ncbi:EbsA family protein [Enterococcus villorum]|uniref:EbsA protein n=1 Tax=Enterococcus villorum TaxID=112904 RepID=A0A511IYE2_9ENTE|nr:EbsA family protein [Enterococcus villorum]GEL90790.1 hypothetical protein EVI01_01270 [Enterococcus villorum]